MIVLLFFCFSSTFLGYVLILFFLKRSWQLVIHVLSGWIVGQIITSLLILIISYFILISPVILLLISLTILIIALFICLFLWKKYDHSIFSISLEESPSYYFTIFVISTISFVYLGNVYQYFPYSLPKLSIPIIDDEVSFISSFLYGINSKRTQIFTFKDPNKLNATFNRSVLPLIFAASLISFDYKIKDVLFFIHFFNIIATTAILFYYSAIQKGNSILFVFLVMLNGGWAFFYHFFSTNQVNTQNSLNNSLLLDFIHDVGFRVSLPIYHFFAHHLSFSLSSSVSVPLSILSLCYAEDDEKNINLHLFGGFLASLIPNFLPSASVFLIAFCNKNSVKGFLPFLLTLLPKYLRSDIIVKPIWREFQNEGYHYSQIFIWFEAFGPMFFSIIYSFRFQNDKKFYYFYLTRLSAFLLLCVFRDGNETFENSIAINSVFVPFIALAFSEIMCNLIHIYRSQKSKTQGFVFAVVVFVSITYILGGIFCLKNSIENKKFELINENDERVDSFIKSNIPFNSLIFARPRRLQPASFLSGRQTLIGYPNDMWNKGGNNITKYLLFYKLIDHHINSTINIMNEIGSSYLLSLNNDSSFIFSTENNDNIIKSIYKNDDWSIYEIQRK